MKIPDNRKETSMTLKYSSAVKRLVFTISLIMIVCLCLSSSADATLVSGVYETSSGATVLEYGDRVPGGSQILPRSATFTFDLDAEQPTLLAVIHNAVVEGGTDPIFNDSYLEGGEQPFELTVRSSSGTQLVDGSYRFTGDYLLDIRPSLYIFNWTFSATTNGSAMWNGRTFWGGGHLWEETITDVALVPEPGSMMLIGAGIVTIWLSRSSNKTHNHRLHSIAAAGSSE